MMGRGRSVAGRCPPSLTFLVVGRKCASITCSGMSNGVKIEVVCWEGAGSRWWWWLWLWVMHYLGVCEVFGGCLFWLLAVRLVMRRSLPCDVLLRESF